MSPRPTMSEEGAAPPVPSFPEKCSIKDAKAALLKMIVDAENDGEMKAELPLLQKWLEDQHADEVRHGKMRCARRDAAPPRAGPRAAGGWPCTAPLRRLTPLPRPSASHARTVLKSVFRNLGGQPKWNRLYLAPCKSILHPAPPACGGPCYLCRACRAEIFARQNSATVSHGPIQFDTGTV